MDDTAKRAGGPLDKIRALLLRTPAARPRRTGDLTPLNEFIARDVRWSEPDVGAHMGFLQGRGAVLEMIRRALDTTGGSFDLRVTSTVETGSHVAASIAWSAAKDGRSIEGQELAVYEVRGGLIVAAWFHPGDVADDRAFWGEDSAAPPSGARSS